MPIGDFYPEGKPYSIPAEKIPESDFEWKLQIKKAENGYILRGKFGNSDNYSERVVEDDDCSPEGSIKELQSHRNLLWEIMEYFALCGSKHDKYRLHVSIIDPGTDEEVKEE